MNYLILTIFCFVLSSCMTGPEIRRDNKSQNRVDAFKPRSQVPVWAAEALITAGQRAYAARDYQKSYDFYISAANKLGSGPKYFECLYWSLRSAQKLNRHLESVEIADGLLKNPALNETQAYEILQSKLHALELGGFYLETVRQIFLASIEPRFKKNRESIELKGLELIQARLTQEELRIITSEAISDAAKSLAYYRLGELALEDRDTSQARSYFGRSLSIAPLTESARLSSAAISQLDSIRKVEPKTIGVVLPMSGKYAGVSQKALRGIQMGLGLYGNSQSSFRLAVVDSEGNPDLARQGVERLVREDNVIAIIGSVLSKTASAVAGKASEMGVPSIALSQKYGITEMGSNVFRNSLTSEMQVRKLVKTAMQDLKLRRFAILFPNDLYGTEYANLFWDEVLANGGTIVGAQSYSTKETDFREPIQRLTGTFFMEARADEYKMLYREWSDSQKKKTGRTNVPEDLLPSIVDFDAIFIPDSAKSLGQISAMLSFSGVKGVKLLGTNLWNVPGIVKRAGNSAQDILFVDSYTVNDESFSKSSFVRDFRNEFSEDPGVIEMQSFDAALMLRQLIQTGAGSREALTRSLSEMKNFPGVMGPISMNMYREIQRPVIPLQIINGNISPLSGP